MYFTPSKLGIQSHMPAVPVQYDADAEKAKEALEHFQLMSYQVLELVRVNVLNPVEARQLLKLDELLDLAKK